MNKQERILAALHNETVDQTPLALWRHFHQEDRDPATLAHATAAFAKRYDLDLVKLTPSGLYGVEDWGANIIYPNTVNDPPYLAFPAIALPNDWLTLKQHNSVALERELQTIRLTRQQLGTDWPMVMTVFSPLTLAYKLAGEQLVNHLRVAPDAVHVGLRSLTSVNAAFAHAALDAGADGLFFASQWMCAGFCTREEYEEFGLCYDLEVLEQVSYRSRITILHLHGTDVFFELADEYPVHAVSWHDRETQPSLAEARQRTDLAFCAGLDVKLLRKGPAQAIADQVRDAVAQTGGRGLVLAPACVISPETPELHLRTAAKEARRNSGQSD